MYQEVSKLASGTPRELGMDPFDSVIDVTSVFVGLATGTQLRFCVGYRQHAGPPPFIRVTFGVIRDQRIRSQDFKSWPLREVARGGVLFEKLARKYGDSIDADKLRQFVLDNVPPLRAA